MTDVVVHDMIEQIYFYLIIFSQKEMGSEKHKADVVVPGIHQETGLYRAYVGSYVGFEKELSEHHVCTSSSNQSLSQTRAVVVAVAVVVMVTTVAVASGWQG
jgi:hypothetical protein